MECTYIEDLVNEVVYDSGTDAVNITAFLDEAVLLRDGTSVYICHRIDMRCCEFIDNVRTCDLLFVLDTVGLEELGVLSLYAEIKLVLSNLLEFNDYFLQIDSLVVGVTRYYMNEISELLRASCR